MADSETQVLVTKVPGRVHIVFDDAEIASTINALKVAKPGQSETVFVPFEDVHPGILEASDTTRDDFGPGAAHFYTLKTLTADGPDNAWYYPYADGKYEAIRDLVTFAGDKIEVRFSDV
jgi:uncharacterized protein (DUF427 family)